MKSKAIVLGHPLHAMLVPFPLAFLTGAVMFDAAGAFFAVEAWWTTGGHLAFFGVLTALVAAVPGVVDYVYTVPPKSSGKVRATRHMVINLCAVALFAAALWLRGGAASRPTVALVGLELVGLLLISVGGYMGGTLVTRNLIGIDHRYARAGKWREETVDAPNGQPVVVARAGELQVDQMKLLHIGGKRIVLARSDLGYVAFDDRCPHRGGSLAGGVMICGTVQCLWHGSQFNTATGAVKSGPAEQPIATYRVVEEGGAVYLTL